MICDVCRGLGSLPTSTGEDRVCPFCRGAGTGQWRIAETKRQWGLRRLRRLGILAFIIADLVFAFWWFGQGDHSGSSFGMAFTFTVFFVELIAIGLVVRLWLTRVRRRRVRGMTGTGEWLALGGLGLFALRHHHQVAQHRAAQQQAINQAVQWPKFPS